MSEIADLNSRLLALPEAGVRMWLDQIRHSMLEGGHARAGALVLAARRPSQRDDQDPRDAESPRAGYSFGTMMAAHGAGDLEPLRSHGVAAERVDAKGDPAEAIRVLTERITAILQEN